MAGRDEVVECNEILQGRKSSKAYLESNEDYLSSEYGGKDVVAVTADGEAEIAAAYDHDSENNWRQALEAIRETYGYEDYLTAVCRRMENE